MAENAFDLELQVRRSNIDVLRQVCLQLGQGSERGVAGRDNSQIALYFALILFSEAQRLGGRRLGRTSPKKAAPNGQGHTPEARM